MSRILEHSVSEVESAAPSNDTGDSSKGTVQQKPVAGGEPWSGPLNDTGTKLMAPNVQARMESAFGEDFSNVGIHTNSSRASGMRAKAFAQGDDVHFAPGQYNPESREGQALLGHELTHVVQQRRGRVHPTTQAKGLAVIDDEGLEHEADEMGERAAQSGGPVRDLSTSPPSASSSPVLQMEDGDEEPGPKELAENIYDAFHGSLFSEDEERALNQIRGKSLDTLRGIRRYYRGEPLEKEFQKYCNRSQTKEALSILFPALSIEDKLRFHVSEGLLGSENEGAMLEVLRTASRSQLVALGTNESVMSELEDWLNYDEYYEALKLIRPESMYENVKWRIKNAAGINDDEEAVFSAILELSPGDRRNLWKRERQVFSFLSGYTESGPVKAGTEMDSVRILCLGTAAKALEEGMRLATEGAGTWDDLVKSVVARTQTAAGKEDALKAMLESGKDAKGNALAEKQIAPIKVELERLGGIRGGLLEARYEDQELKEGSFLAMLEGDVSRGEFESFMTSMRVSDFDRAKSAILNAPGFFNDDEQAIWDAFESIKDPKLRDRLSKDREVKKALKDAFSEAEFATLEYYEKGDTFHIAVHKLEEAYYGFDTDEEEIFRILLSMSSDDRKRLKNEAPLMYLKLTSPFYMDKDEIPLIKEAIETGKISTDKALEWAMGGGWDGTTEELIRDTFDRMGQEEHFKYRLGYFLYKGGKALEIFVEKGIQDEALATFTKLYNRLVGELGTDDLHDALDHLLGVPTLVELKSGEGRKMAVFIMQSRVLEKGAVRDRDTVSSWFMDVFSETGEISDQAEIAFRAAYYLAFKEDKVSDAELALLGALEENFKETYAEFVATTETVAEIASTVAAIAVAVGVTILTGGTAGPGAAAGLSSYLGTTGSVIVAAASAGATKVGVSELIAGEHYDTLSTEGLEDLVVGGVEGAMTALTAGIAKSLSASFWALVGLKEAQLSAELTAGVLRATGVSLRQAGKRFAVGGLEAAIDGALSGAVGELVLTAMDQKVWQKSIWDTVLTFGWAVLRGAGIGAATGFVTGGAIESLIYTLGVRRYTRLLTRLEEVGHGVDDLDKLTLSQVRALGEIDDAVAKGEREAAEEALERFSRELDPDLAAALRTSLFDTRKRSADEIIAAVKQKIKAKGGGKFKLNYSQKELRKIIEEGRAKGLSDEVIEDMIFVGSRKDKLISADNLIEQMGSYVDIVLRRGFPYRFSSAEQFAAFKTELKTKLENVDLPTSDVRIQGSALRTAGAKDVDIAVFLDDESFDTKLLDFFNGRVKRNGESIDISAMSRDDIKDLVEEIEKDSILRNKQFSAPARTFMYAYRARKIRPQDIPGLRSAKKTLESTFGELDISVMAKGGGFDIEPSMPLY